MADEYLSFISITSFSKTARTTSADLTPVEISEIDLCCDAVSGNQVLSGLIIDTLRFLCLNERKVSLVAICAVI